LFYPVVVLVSLAAGGTHDFESHHLDTLIGPPHRTDLYRARSPVRQADRITVALLVFQGAQDVICPPARATAFAQASRHTQQHVFRTFEGEGHGFRRQSTLIACLETELHVYGGVFGFAPL
jgi:dipeptidyl aminopeptidase/acylaminoacyl peptidase